MPSSSRFKFNSQRALIRIERILDVLSKESLSVEMLSQRIHATQSLTNAYVKYLRASPKRIYVQRYTGPEDDGFYRPVALYRKGRKPDAELIVRTKADVWRETKADPAKLEKARAQGRAKRLKNMGRDHLVRQCRKYDPPLIVQVREFVEQRPGYNFRMIAEHLDGNISAVKHALSDLKKAGEITSEKRDKDGGRWVSLTKPPVKHAAANMPKQGFWAALGI